MDFCWCREHQRSRRDVAYHQGIGANPSVVTDLHPSQYFCPWPDRDIVADLGAAALPFADRNLLKNIAVTAYPSAGVDHDPVGMGHLQTAADLTSQRDADSANHRPESPTYGSNAPTKTR